MIFAAGLGTRLKPLTDYMPKALVPVAGKPLLQILLEKLQTAGFDDIVINVHHFADQIEDWCAQNPMGMKICFSDERTQLRETGGGVRHAAPLLRDADRFLIHNVDILSNVDLDGFYRQGALWDATLLVSQRETQRYLLFDDDMRLVGWNNIKTGEVKSPYPHLDPEKYRKYAFAGIHQMNSRLLTRMNDWPEKFSIIDFYLSMCSTCTIYGIVQEGLRLLDVGKLDTLSEAENFVNA